MATVLFVHLDQNFSMVLNTFAAFSSQDGTASGFEYSYLTTGGGDWEFDGAGITTSGGGQLNGGTIDAVQLDMDNDNETVPEVSIVGLGGVAASTFGIGVGLFNQQRDAFWSAALGGGDTFIFTMADYTVNLDIYGDRPDISDGLSYTGGADTFVDGGTGLTGFSKIIGDFQITNGTGNGGADSFTVGAQVLIGDFDGVSAGATGVGGDDSISPARLADNAGGFFWIIGDAVSVQGTLTAGDDTIDLRNTNVTGVTQNIFLMGDTAQVNGGGAVIGGSDTIYGSSRGEFIYGDDGNDSAGVTGGMDYIYAGGGADSIKGQGGNDFLSGGAGADTLDGGDGFDTAYYFGASAGVNINLATGVGLGDEAQGDTLIGIEHVVGTQHDDTITGDAAVFQDLTGGSGADSISGGDGQDRMFGGFGVDTLIGGAGSDTVFSGDDGDSLDGGADIDTANYIFSLAAVAVSLETGLGTGGEAAGDTLTGIENITGSTFNDTLTGSNGVANYLTGDDGADSLSGLSGADTVDAGAGDDTLVGGDDNDEFAAGDGDDVMDGGAGGDLAFGGAGDDDIAGVGGDDTLLGQGGRDTMVGGGSNDALYGGDAGDSLRGGLENDQLFGEAQHDYLGGDGGNDSLDAGTGDDTVFGGTQRDRAFGGSGADLINGGGGNDTLQGGNDNDTLLGGKLFDVLQGGDGNDSLDGGLGDDIIFGETGNDTIVFALGGAQDTLRDFTEGAGVGDVIRLVGFGPAFDTFAEILAAATDNGVDTTIAFGGGDTLILRGVVVSQLNADDFTFG